MAKYQLEFSGSSTDRWVIIDDGKMAVNPYEATQGSILTDALVQGIADSIALSTGRTLYNVTRVNTLDTIYP